MRVRFVREEEGFTMTLVILALFLVSILVAGALAATNGDIHLTANDLDHKRAYAAAEAGVADYAFHLDRDTTYWTKCVPNPPGAVNQMGSTANRRTVAGSSDESYATELIPATGQSSCVPGNNFSMLEQTGQNAGTFRIRSTGYSGSAKQSIVATFKRASFLDYVYFTQLETSDPVTYANLSTLNDTVNGANAQCTKTIAEGRYGQFPGDPSALIPGSLHLWCDVISFKDGEQINGPLHTNDALVVCGSPSFGRGPSDAIEVSSPPRGWYTRSQLVLSNSCTTGQPNFVGTYFTNAPVLTPPPSNGQLKPIAQSESCSATTGAVGCQYTNQVQICLDGSSMYVDTSPTAITPGTGSCTGTRTTIPSGGLLVYVANGAGCSSGYSPYTSGYANPSPCGNVFVRSRGTTGYSGQLTIAAENDIIVDGNLCRGPCNQAQPSGPGMLGLIANNFVRVYHPWNENLPQVNLSTSQILLGSGCQTDPNGTNASLAQHNLRIDAAILAISHSFVVDHYDCPSVAQGGGPLGTLTIHGAVAQKFRGAVGTFGSQGQTISGYDKNYSYDDRLRYAEPPHFLDPVQVAWHVSRETLDYP